MLGEIVSDPALPTILVYGHYDVQPPDPLEKWITPPFEPTIRDGRLYARGVSDDKGPMLIPILVAEAFLKTAGRLPVNIKMLVEGEEESGSPHFAPLVERLRERLACDLVVSADGAMWRADRPSITVASRGLVALDVTVTGAAKDLHSGRHGGSAPNPVRALAAAAGDAARRRRQRRRAGLPRRRRAARSGNPRCDRRGCLRHASLFQGDRRAAARPAAERPRSFWCASGCEPTLEFNGIFGGYSGTGHEDRHSVVGGRQDHLPARRRAGPGQGRRGDRAASCRRSLPTGYSLAVERHGPGSRAFSIDPDLPALAIAETLLGEMLGAKALRVAMGATIPIGAVFKEHLGAGTIFFSFSTSDEDYHAPNEFFRLENFRIGQIAWARLLERLGTMARRTD